MMTSTALRAMALAGAVAMAGVAHAQNATAIKKELVQRVLQAQQTEIEGVSRNVVERPAAQMMQEAGLALRQVPADKREAMARSIEAEVKKYVEESYPLARERALKIAPATIGVALEEKMSEDELKQLLAWLESPTNKKFQELGPEMRNTFIQKLLVEVQPAVDPKIQALDGRIRVILGVPPAQTSSSASKPAASGKANTKATGK